MTDFLDFLMHDVLHDLPGFAARRMFGGYGLRLNGIFCGIVSKDTLYLKTDESTRPDFEKYGCKPFTYAPGKTLKTYYQVPSAILEDADELKIWIKKSAEAAKKNAD